jgi:hypothetical protein
VKTHVKIKKVLYIDSEPSFLEQQKKKLSHKELDSNLYSFSNFSDAFEFIETHIIEKNNKLHYIILDEKLAGKHLSNSLDKLWGLNDFLKKPDIIIIADENNAFLRNRIMQYPFVTAYLVKPIPSNYIEFLITGQVG